MKHVHALRFESLEGRALLSGIHAAHSRAAHAAHRIRHRAHAAVAAPLTLDGTLNVIQNQSSTGPNVDGGYTNIVPVSGQLSGIGAVRGVWFESTDMYGNYVGPDTITLHASGGSITLAFSNATSGPAHKEGHTVYYQHVQRLLSGSGVYAGDTERGSIHLNENPAHTVVVSMTLNGG